MSEITDGGFESKRIYCNRCKDETNHVLRGSHSRYYSEDEGLWEEFIHRFWTCAGCETGTLEVAWTATGMYDGEKEIYEYSYHPARGCQDLVQKVFRHLPKPLATIYREVVDAYNHRLHLLCAAGLRILIEGICQEKNVPGRRLEEKIEGLKAILPGTSFRTFMGSASWVMRQSMSLAHQSETHFPLR